MVVSFVIAKVYTVLGSTDFSGAPNCAPTLTSGDHTSYVLLLVAPIYALAPATETLLILQAIILGLVIVMSGHRRRGFLVASAGALAFAVLQHLVIPHFAGGAHSYTWYYSDMIPVGEGPRGLLTTAMINPIFTLKFALTQPKALYVLQLFAPLPFFTVRGAVLISYGLAATLLASRPPLHQIGFQYALTLLARGFIGALLTLHRLSEDGRRRALTAVVLLAIVTCSHYGMIWPRHHFTGGFTTIHFDYSEQERERHRDLMELVERIPPDAAVLTGENLVPHVARRRIVETTRHVHDRKFPHYDFILVVDDGDVQRLRRTPGLNGLRGGYDIVGRSGNFILFKARTDG
jgi:uncharacterized membrane protein